MHRLRLRIAPFETPLTEAELRKALLPLLRSLGSLDDSNISIDPLWSARGEGIQDSIREYLADRGEASARKIKSALPQFTPVQVESALKRLSVKKMISSYGSKATGRTAWKYYLNAEQKSQVLSERKAALEAKPNALRVWDEFRAWGYKRGDEVSPDVFTGIEMSWVEVRAALKVLKTAGKIAIAYYPYANGEADHTYHVWIGAELPESAREAELEAKRERNRATRRRTISTDPNLGLLRQAGTMTTQGLAGERGVTRSTIYRQMMRLEEKGLVQHRKLGDGSIEWYLPTA